MRKSFTLLMFALFAVVATADAQNYRKWDFTNWSAATVANLKADAAASSTVGWSDIEKAADAGEGKVAPETTADKCFWSASTATITGDGTLQANGVTIAETEGLIFGSSYAGNRSLAIAVNYPSTTIGTYAGPQYLWLGGGNKDEGKRLLCFTIPKVKIGQKITVVAESHKSTDARGISLFVNDVNVNANQVGESFEPTTQASYTWEDWTLPEGITDEDGDGTVDILVYNTNGCHIYSIEVGTADQKSKIGYLYQGATDGAKAIAEANANYEVEAIDVATTAITAEQLRGYDVTVVAGNIAGDNAAVSVLKEAQPWTPIVSTNTALYEAWGYGTLSADHEPIIKLKNKSHSLFRGVEVQTEDESDFIPVGMDSYVSGITLADRFKDDVVPGVTMDEDELPLVHVHNATHNAFVYVPFPSDATDEAKQILANAISLAAASKSEVTPLVAPTFSLEYKDMRTLVTIKSSVAGADIYYTIDNSQPTEASAKYSEPIEVTAEGVTVKAVAIAEGYTLSDVAEKAIDLKQQTALPVIAVDQQSGKTVVTVTGAEGTTLWYNFTQSSDTLKSTKYVTPITYTLPREGFSAFAVAEGKVNSEVATQDIKIADLKARIDVLAHMDANSTEYNNGSTSTAYYFSWGKNKATYSYYNTEAGSTEETTTDPETGDEVITKTYNELNPEEEKDFNNGWAIRARGQIVDWENLESGKNYGDRSGYNFATVDDENPYFPATKSIINLADKNTQPADVTFPYNAYIVTTKKFAGPFDVVLNVGSIVKPADGTVTKHQFVVEVSKDGNKWENEWQVLGDTLKMEGLNRLTKNFTRSYEGTDEVYVRVYLSNNNSKIGIYDIYIANEGEKSLELETAITPLRQDATAVKTAAIYDLNGRRRASLQRGLNIVRMSDGTAKKVMVK